MYYRYEARRTGLGYKYKNDEDGWKGLFQVLPPSPRRKASRFLHEPKWYSHHPGEQSECWFTEYGYRKYHKQMEDLIQYSRDCYDPLEIRILTKEELECVAMQGKVQCICKKRCDNESKEDRKIRTHILKAKAEIMGIVQGIVFVDSDYYYTDTIKIHPIHNTLWLLDTRSLASQIEQNDSSYSFISIRFDKRQIWEARCDNGQWSLTKKDLHLTISNEEFEKIFGKYQINKVYDAAVVNS